MSLLSCYDSEGVEYRKQPVDCRECCEILGYTMDNSVDSPSKATTKTKEPEAKAPKKKAE